MQCEIEIVGVQGNSDPMLHLQACKGRRNRWRRIEEGTPSAQSPKNRGENPEERSKVKGRSTTSNRRRRSRPSKGAPSVKLPEERFKERSDERSSVPCWRRLASHVEADYAVAHHLAFDTFLPALVEDLSLRLAGPISAAAASTVSTEEQARDHESTSQLPSSDDGRERLEAVAVLGGDESGVAVGSIPGFSGSGLTYEVLWEPPFLKRWPEVLTVSPSSAPAETCPLSSKSASLFGGKPGSLFAVEGNGAAVEGTSRDGTEARRRALGHRVLITGRYFAHPVDGRRESCRVSSRDNNAVGLENPPGEPSYPWVQRSSHLEKGMTIQGRREDQTAEKPSSCGMREVFVRFGEVEVRGKVLSDCLVEAFAPPSYRPGFVEISVAVKGGVGGDLVSNASVSGTRRCKRRVLPCVCELRVVSHYG